MQTYENALSQEVQRDILLSLYNIRNTFNQELDNLEVSYRASSEITWTRRTSHLLVAAKPQMRN